MVPESVRNPGGARYMVCYVVLMLNSASVAGTSCSGPRAVSEPIQARSGLEARYRRYPEPRPEMHKSPLMEVPATDAQCHP